MLDSVLMLAIVYESIFASIMSESFRMAGNLVEVIHGARASERHSVSMAAGSLKVAIMFFSKCSNVSF